MNHLVVATIFTGTAAAFMLFILHSVQTDKMRIAMIWAGASAIAFLVPIKALAILLVGVMLLALAPLKAATRVGVYVAVFMALPHHYRYDIPFPGLNYLIDMDFVKLASLTLLAPLLFSKSLSPPPERFKIIERLLLAFVLISGVVTIREFPMTTVLRQTVNQFILIYIPYVVISRSMTNIEDVQNAVRAFLAGVVVLAGVAAISSLREWNYFAAIGYEPGMGVYSHQRGGFLRIHATSGPPILALSMAAGMVISLYLRSKSALSIFHLAVLAPLFAFVVFVSGSRGGQLAVVVALASYFALPRLGHMLRRFVIPSAVALAIGFVWYVARDDVVFDDAYGTFQYRAEILRTGMEQIARKPLFGSLRFLERPEFQALIQGEGIVDLVNSYLQIALYYGLVGLTLFLSAQYLTLSNAFRVFSAMDDRRMQTLLDRKDTKRLCSVLVAMHVSYLVLIFTTSDYTWTWQYGYAILGLQSGLAIAAAREQERQATVQTPQAEEPQPIEPPRQEPPRGKPYGARFVRRS